MMNEVRCSTDDYSLTTADGYLTIRRCNIHDNDNSRSITLSNMSNNNDQDDKSIDLLAWNSLDLKITGRKRFKLTFEPLDRHAIRLEDV